MSAAQAYAAEVLPDDFGALYDAHVDFVWRMLERLGVPSANTEDAVQEVFLVVHRRRAEFRHASSLRTWIGGIAVRVAKDARRQLRRKGGHAPLEHLRSVAHEGPGPLETAANAQAMQLVLRLLESLDEDQRTVFVLAELEQLTAPEIAEVTGTNLNTVSSRLRLARKHFNTRLAAHRQQAGEA